MPQQKKPTRRDDEGRKAIRITHSLNQRLQQIAAAEHNGVSAVARRLISKALDLEDTASSKVRA